jgi:hypothetical protein
MRGIRAQQVIIFLGERVMKTINSALMISLIILLVLPARVQAASVEFELLTHADYIGLLPQQQQSGGDYLPRTGDDVSGATLNPNGCFSFNFMNPDGITEPASYAKSVHSMTGSLILDIDLQAGGTVDIVSLAFDGYIDPSKSSAQWLDDGSNNGTYVASAASNWTFEANFNWCYDTPFAGTGTTDVKFENYPWTGFIIPVSELTTDGMAATVLDDPLGYFGGNFESWLLNKVAPQLPEQATHLLFTQGQANPSWTNPQMGMTTDSIVGETIIGYAVPEPATMMLLAAGLCCIRGMRRPQKSA